MSTYTDASLIVTPNSKKAGKLYSLKGADLDVVRATTATYVGSDGLIKTALANEVRFDYTNGSCPSILVEPQRTNSLLRSEQFDDAYWVKLSSTILSNNIISPSGTLTADKLNSNTVNTEHRVVRDIALPSVVETLSIFAKKGEYNFLGFRVGILGGFQQLNFNLENGTFTNHGVVEAYTNIQMQYYGNGWWRCSASFLRTNTLIQFHALQNNLALPSYIGDNNSGIYLWGAQLEVGSNATSYIPTVASAMTRNADVISKSGISSLINGESGTLFLNSASLANDGTTKYFSINNGTTNNEIVFQYTSTSNTVGIRYLIGGIPQCDASVLITNALDFNKFAFTWQLNKFELWCNGIKVISDTSGSVTTSFNQIDFRSSNGTIPFFSKVKSVVLWKTALTDQECIALTTL